MKKETSRCSAKELNDNIQCANLVVFSFAGQSSENGTRSKGGPCRCLCCHALLASLYRGSYSAGKIYVIIISLSHFNCYKCCSDPGYVIMIRMFIIIMVSGLYYYTYIVRNL